MSLQTTLPVTLSPVALRPGVGVGLIVVDAGVAFTREGALSDPTHMIPMVERIDALIRRLQAALGPRLQILCFLDTHHADIPEPPYPTHGVIGTGEELMDPLLAWLEAAPGVLIVKKDCINGFVGAIDRATGENALCAWVKRHGLQELLVVGDCTDICVSDLVVSMLSARNHGLFTDASPATERARYVADIVNTRVLVLSEGVETFDAPFHNREAAHHVGLWTMASRGAVLVSELQVQEDV
jgi:nicotinamidase-related amidase